MIGWPAVQAILGGMVAPGLLDRLLARRAHEGQMTPEAETPGRPDNLFAPVAGDHGAHGRFDASARDRLAILDPALLRTGVALAALALAGRLGAGALASRRGRAGRPRLPAG